MFCILQKNYTCICMYVFFALCIVFVFLLARRPPLSVLGPRVAALFDYAPLLCLGCLAACCWLPVARYLRLYSVPVHLACWQLWQLAIGNLGIGLGWLYICAKRLSNSIIYISYIM
jgi:hypothetical protein